ncbi:MAG: MFS transporter [Chloroflexi bacterium]|nr:MFS transporter [Chloroflexota bacterium]
MSRCFAQLWIAQGNFDAAQQWTRERSLRRELDLTELDLSEDYLKYHLRKYEYLVLARLRIAQGRADDGILGFGMAMPIFPFLITRLGGSGTEFGWLIAVYCVMQLVFSPVWGSISDRVGPKPVLVIGMLGTALSYALSGLATELWMLFIARIFSGLLASAMLPTAMAYIGDCTSDQDRGGWTRHRSWS